jgi:hypothetical protein
MKALICINKIADVDLILSWKLEKTSIPFLYKTNYLQHSIYICETGYGIFQVGYKIAKALSFQKYHLALKFALCNSYNESLHVGTVVNVIKEKAGDIGVFTEEGFKDLYEVGLLNNEEFPHFKGSFINMNNSYMNVFLDYKKVVSVTVNSYANANFLQTKEKYKADVETGDGLAFVYTCLCERQPFYQINVVEKNLVSQEKNVSLALEKLNSAFNLIIEKI